MGDGSDSKPNSRALQWMSLLLLLVSGAFLWTLIGKSKASAPPEPTTPPPVAIEARGDLSSSETSTIKLFKQTSPSVVHVTSIAIRRNRLTLNVLKIPQGTGSGFVWDKEGHIVTNHHVVQNANELEVTFASGARARAKIVGVAPDKDLAVIKVIENKEPLTPILIGNSKHLEVGQSVFAIGNPFGLDQSLTTGIISGLNREIESTSRRPIFDVIQTDAAINAGNSGGPLLDSAGRLIGINTAIYSKSGGNIGIGFAVPVSTVLIIVPQIIEHGAAKRPGLGIGFGSKDMEKKLGFAGITGVVVLKTTKDGAADKAGIVGPVKNINDQWIPGDIVVGLDNQPVLSSADLFRILDQKNVGDTVDIEVERNGEKRSTKVVLQDLQ